MVVVGGGRVVVVGAMVRVGAGVVVAARGRVVVVAVVVVGAGREELVGVGVAVGVVVAARCAVLGVDVLVRVAVVDAERPSTLTGGSVGLSVLDLADGVLRASAVVVGAADASFSGPRPAVAALRVIAAVAARGIAGTGGSPAIGDAVPDTATVGGHSVSANAKITATPAARRAWIGNGAGGLGGWWRPIRTAVHRR